MKTTQRDEPIGLLIGAVRQRIKQAVAIHASRYHLTSQQFWILAAINEHPGFSLGELAAHLRMDNPTASRVVFTLVKRKLIQVRGHSTDRRRACLHLEPAAAVLAKDLDELATAIRAAVVRGLSAAEQAILRSSLRKIVANMDRFQHSTHPDEPMKAGSRVRRSTPALRAAAGTRT